MSSFFANLALFIATLVYFSLFYVLLFQKAPRGDAGVGYSWMVLLGYLVMLLAIILATVAIGAKDGFSWVGQSGNARLLMVGGGLLLSLAATGMSTFGEPLPIPGIGRIMGVILPFLVPLLLIFGEFILNNDSIRNQVSPQVYQMPLRLAGWIGVVTIGLVTGSWLLRSGMGGLGKFVSFSRFDSEMIQGDLANIDSINVQRDMVFLLSYTDDNHAPAVRERAVNRVKSRLHWEQEMIRLLECDWAPDAFTFLAYNAVDDKQLFAEPVQAGALNVAKAIRENIQASTRPEDLYSGKFASKVKETLLTVDKFEGLGVDYRPAVRAIRAAFEEPRDYEKPDFREIKMLDKWIKEHP